MPTIHLINTQPVTFIVPHNGRIIDIHSSVPSAAYGVDIFIEDAAMLGGWEKTVWKGTDVINNTTRFFDFTGPFMSFSAGDRITLTQIHNFQSQSIDITVIY